MSTVSQRSFAGGELAPALHARVDTAKYATGARTIRNGFIMRHGGQKNRAGTSWVGEVKDSTKAVRLIEFIFNDSQTYALEFGNLYMRPIKDGSYLFETAKVISGVTAATQGVVTSTSHGFADGDTVFIDAVVGMTELNGRYYFISDKTTHTFKLKYMDGTYVNTSTFTAYSSAGTASRVYQLTTTYLEADLFDLKYVQSADVITIVHPSYPPRELSRTGDTSWSIANIAFGPTIGYPQEVEATLGAAGALTFSYLVTSFDPETGEESDPGATTGGVKNISSVGSTNPVLITTTANHGYATGATVLMRGSDTVQINKRLFKITVTGVTTFTLDGEDGTAYLSAGAVGTVTRVSATISSAATPTSASPNIVAWNQLTFDGTYGSEFNIYRDLNGVFGFIGIARGRTFSDIGYTPDTSDTPSLNPGLFDAAGEYPSAVTYSQQRLLFANSTDDPETAWGSKTSNYHNFNHSTPLADDDAIEFTLASRQVNSIQHMLDVGKLFLFSSGGEHLLLGGASGVITPTDINVKTISYNGSGTVRPLVVDSRIIYIQARGAVVRTINYDANTEQVNGADLTTFAAHLVDGHQIVDWAYQQVPHSIIWIVRDDGVLLGITHNAEQEILAWHRHDTDGLVESVCVIPEGTEDVVYLVVKRTIDGRSVRYIERQNTRDITADNLVDAIFMDAAATYDGRNTGSATMTLSEYSSGGWLSTSLINITCSSSLFEVGCVGDEIHLTGSDGAVLRITIETRVSATVVRGRPNQTVPVAMRTGARTTWSRATMEVDGLWHLEGEAVSVFGDGMTVASPNNEPAADNVVVTDGVITLDQCFAVIQVGLPYISDLETLDIDTVQGETLADKKKALGKVTLQVEKTAGLFVGGTCPEENPENTDDDPLYGLTEIKPDDDDGEEDGPSELRTGKIDIVIETEWNSTGRVFIRQVDPVPMSVLAVSPAGWIPFKG